jgi:hypothetical protein
MINSITRRDQLIDIINKLASMEGWSIYDCEGSVDGDWQIQADFSKGILKSDHAAHDYIKMRALEGSIIHAAALGIVSTLNPLEALVIFSKKYTHE